jgi:hypothetical protein
VGQGVGSRSCVQAAVGRRAAGRALDGCLWGTVGRWQACFGAGWEAAGGSVRQAAAVSQVCRRQGGRVGHVRACCRPGRLQHWREIVRQGRQRALEDTGFASTLTQDCCVCTLTRTNCCCQGTQHLCTIKPLVIGSAACSLRPPLWGVVCLPTQRTAVQARGAAGGQGGGPVAGALHGLLERMHFVGGRKMGERGGPWALQCAAHLLGSVRLAFFVGTAWGVECGVSALGAPSQRGAARPCNNDCIIGEERRFTPLFPPLLLPLALSLHLPGLAANIRPRPG